MDINALFPKWLEKVVVLSGSTKEHRPELFTAPGLHIHFLEHRNTDQNCLQLSPGAPLDACEGTQDPSQPHIGGWLGGRLPSRAA